MLCIIVNFVTGRYINHRKARLWLDLVTPTLKLQFKELKASETLDFEDYTSSTFTLILSGRSNIHYCNFILDFERRHNIQQMFLRILCSRWMKFQRDLLIVEIPINRSQI